MRTTVVSTSKLKTTRMLGIGIIAALYILVADTTIQQVLQGHSFTGIAMIIMWTIIFYKAVKTLLRLRTVSYDDSALYYQKNGFEVQIPFEEIKNIEIKTLTGIYTVNLYEAAQDGKSIPFKMSLWYPLNFKRQDACVDELRTRIKEHKMQLRPQNHPTLGSYSI